MLDQAQEWIDNPSEAHRAGLFSRIALAAAVAIWCIVQGYLILMPLHTRTMLPEPDDTLPYILRTAKMAECFSRDCPALEDLKQQLSAPSPNHEIETYRAWVGSVFGSQHPLFSLVLLGLRVFGIDLFAAYQVVCIAAVFLFGAGFAYLLAALYGLPVAGIALMFLAFKVFPDTGLNFVVPSNLAMGLFLFVLARVIHRRGRAPWVLPLGAVAMAGTHPIGLLYAAIAAAVAWSLAGYAAPRKTWLAAAVIAGIVVVAAFLVPLKFYGLPKYLELVSPSALLKQGMASAAAIFAQLDNLKEGLAGSIPLLFAAVAGGWLTLERERRVVLKKVLVIYGVVLFAVLFYPPREPGDTFFRIWIPAAAVVFGLVGRSVWYAIRLFRTSDDSPMPGRRAISVVLLALLAGWWLQMVYAGVEQVLITAEHFKKRQPLQVCDSQPRLLLSAAKPGDRVLYLSMLVMPYYLVHGCLKVGAVYYHDALKDTDAVREWLSRPELRFAVAYNPLVYHPSFEGLHERRWGISAPAFRFSEWNDPRLYGPVLQEDAIPLGDYKWIDIEPGPGAFPGILHLTVDNSGTDCSVRVIGVGESGEPISGLETIYRIGGEVRDQIPNEYEGTANAMGRLLERHRRSVRIDVDLQPFAGRVKRLRLVFSGWKTTARLAGLSFDHSRLNWPWDRKARLTLMHRKWEVGQMTFAFDPAGMLPDPVNRRDIKVLDDCGGSVLFQIGR